MATARRKIKALESGGQGFNREQLLPAQVLLASGTTSNATPLTIHEIDTVADNTVTMLNFQVQATEAATGDSALFDVVALVRRDGSSVTTLKELTFKNGPFRDQAAWDVTIPVGGPGFSVQVTGEAAKTIKWQIFGWATAQAS